MQQPDYYRPQSVEEAVSLLASAEDAAILAGGTQLVPHLRNSGPAAIIDLQAAGMDGVGHAYGRLTLGAMVRVQTLVDDVRVPALLRDLARLEGPNTFRNQGTIGGVIMAAAPDSELLAGLLVFAARVTVHSTSGAQEQPLADFLASANPKGSLLTEITLETGGATAHARVARTPADTPIVAAVARRDDANHVHLALCGVAPKPILAGEDDLDHLDPPGDFRGSPDYRRAMARTLAQRVRDQLET